jgi:hypothetical protein
MNIIIEIKGGIGKCIIATSILGPLRLKYPKDKIIIVSSHPHIFENNLNVDVVSSFKSFPSFYPKYIKNQECIFFISEPYQHSDIINCKRSLYEVWFEMFGLEYKNEQPKIYLTPQELNKSKEIYKSEKPIFVLQTKGGDSLNEEYNWARDLPLSLVKQIINYYKNQYTIYHIRSKDQPHLPGTIPACEDIKTISTLIRMSSKRLFIDSFAQHLAASVSKPSTVCWIATSPKVFGFQNPNYFHDNIISNPIDFETQHTTYSGYSLIEDIKNLPYQDPSRIFDLNIVIDSINKQV